MNKDLIIRADATSRTGIGHVMRCIALGQAWQDNGGKVIFISHCESDVLRKRIVAEGIEFIPLDKPHPDPFDSKFTIDTLRIQKSELKPWVVVDGYHFDPVYQKAIRAAGFHLLAIDDMAKWPEYHADIILNQNLGAEKLKYNCGPDTKLLLGPRYALLRREFMAWRDWQRQIPKVARKVLVSMGGSDPDNATQKVIEALSQTGIEDLEVVVVVGGSNPYFQELESAVHGLKVPLRLVRDPANMAELMAWADLTVTAGGSTCWELAFMGLPALILILADNQATIAFELEKHGLAINLGWHNLFESSDIAGQLRSMIMSSEKRGSMSNCGRKLVDGGGGVRVIRQLKGRKFALRTMQAEDCRLIWEWANDPVARALSFSTEKITWEKHAAWFESKRTDPSVYFYMVLDNYSVPVGQIRYQITGQEADVSVSLAPSQRGSGYGAEIIRMGAQELWDTANVKVIHAYIKQDNTASIRAFAKAGFINSGMTEVHGCSALHYMLRKTQDHE